MTLLGLDTAPAAEVQTPPPTASEIAQMATKLEQLRASEAVARAALAAANARAAELAQQCEISEQAYLCGQIELDDLAALRRQHTEAQAELSRRTMEHRRAETLATREAERIEQSEAELQQQNILSTRRRLEEIATSVIVAIVGAVGELDQLDADLVRKEIDIWQQSILSRPPVSPHNTDTAGADFFHFSVALKRLLGDDFRTTLELIKCLEKFDPEAVTPSIQETRQSFERRNTDRLERLHVEENGPPIDPKRQLAWLKSTNWPPGW